MASDATVKAAWITGVCAVLAAIAGGINVTWGSDREESAGQSVGSTDPAAAVHEQSVAPEDLPVEQPDPVPDDEPLPPVEAPAEVFPSRTSAPVGETVLIGGRGFDPGEQVVLRIGAHEVGRTTADSAGGFSGVAVTVPEFYANFQKPMQLDVSATGRSSIEHADTPFTIS